MTYSVWPRIHSLYGRFLGVTPEGWLTAENGAFMDRANSFTSASTGTLVPSAGINYFSLTTAFSTGGSTAAFLMDYPKPGVSVTFANIAASTQTISITTTSAIIAGQNTMMGSTVSFATLTSASSAYTTVRLQGLGNSVTLEGVTTAYFILKSLNGYSSAAASNVLI